MVNIGPCINLEGVNLMRVNLEEHDLTEANLTRANLMGANLTEANLEVAILTRANLEGANLTGANLEGATLPKASSLKFCLVLNSKIGGAITSVSELLDLIKSSRNNEKEYNIYKNHLEWIKQHRH